ncbi:MAG: Hsp70 family protein [Armatimonadetes bacterium]|nr:Hsp70 family protein [Armatimonadota bacterium]
MSQISLGLDFGTSTCKIASYDSATGVLQDLPLEGGRLVPSFIAFVPREKRPVLGAAAKGRISGNDVQVYPELSDPIHYPPVKLGIANPDFVGCEFDDESYDAEAMVEEFFLWLYDIADAIGAAVTAPAIVTVPAYFTSLQRAAIVAEAGKAWSIAPPGHLPEPVAAALAHHQERPGSLQGNCLVYDFGGGTFDTTVIAVGQERFDVYEKLGLPELGGYNLDRLVYDHLLRPTVERATGLALDVQTGLRGEAQAIAHTLMLEAENLRIALSSQKTVALPYQPLHGRRDLGQIELHASRTEYNKLISGHVDDTLRRTEEVIRLAGLEPDDIDHVLLVGGVTRTPLIRDRLTERFPGRVVEPNDRDTLAAKGAALFACEEVRQRLQVRDVLARSLSARDPETGQATLVIRRGEPLEHAEGTYRCAWPGGGRTAVGIMVAETAGSDWPESPAGMVVMKPAQPEAPPQDVLVTFKYDEAVSHAQFPYRATAGGFHLEFSENCNEEEARTVGVPRLDLVFCLDVSGSARRGVFTAASATCRGLVQALLDSRFEEVQKRVALVGFSDEEVTGERLQIEPFRPADPRLCDELLEALAQCGGDGGDAPEQVFAALHEAITLLREPQADTVQLVLLFTDAPPKVEKQDWDARLAERLRRGKIALHVCAPEGLRRHFGAVYDCCSYHDVHRELAGVPEQVIAQLEQALWRDRNGRSSGN